jgi:hypothetical protein
MALDKRSGVSTNSDPADNAVAVVPSDSTDLTYVASALIIGVGGTVIVDTAGGQTGVAIKVQSGQILPLRVTRVRSTNTTATDIVALY